MKTVLVAAPVNAGISVPGGYPTCISPTLILQRLGLPLSPSCLKIARLNQSMWDFIAAHPKKNPEFLAKKIHDCIEEECRKVHDAGFCPLVIGGDHSVTIGAVRAAAKKHNRMGFLVFDAHSDAQNPHERGFDLEGSKLYCHSTVLWHVCSNPGISHAVLIGERDMSDPENEKLPTIRVPWQRCRLDVEPDGNCKKLDWLKCGMEVIDSLPEKIYISVDVDCLAHEHAPDVGAPIPCGIQLNDLMAILDRVGRSGRRIVGMDLVETVPNGDSPDVNLETAVVIANKLRSLR